MVVVARWKYRLWLGNQVHFAAPSPPGMDLTINDPGNAELAITVRLHPSGDAAHLWGFLFFLERAHGRRPAKAGPGCTRRKDYFVRLKRPYRGVSKKD